MINNLFNNKYHIIIIVLSIFSIYFGFFLEENLTGGPKNDFTHALKQVDAFEKDLKYSFFNFDKIENSTRISPVFIFIVYVFKQILVDIDFVRFLLMNIIILSQFFFYKCLKIYFNSNEISDKLLLVLSCIIFFSPSFRSNSIWPESAMLGLLFFVISIFYFLKFEKKNKIKYCLLNILFLSIASYIRPSYCLFAIFYFLEFVLILHEKEKFVKNIILLTIFNLILALPAFYYVFIMDVFFIKYGGLSANYFNKISIISSIIFFHLIPIMFYKYKDLSFDLSKEKILIISIIFFSLIITLYFDYNLELSGGGIVLHFSNFIFQNNLIFYIVLPLFFYSLIKLVLINKLKNFTILLILLLLTPQYHIFHKYYDPLIIILALTLFRFEINKNFFYKTINLSFLYFLYIIYFSINTINYFFLI